MLSIEKYRSEFISYLESRTQTKEPQNLYAPITYILNLGGKRLRPVLTLMATEIFGKDSRIALDAALAVEIFHNFSLVHDDIMDAAPLRRGKATVHEKWDVNTGILSGDAMLIMAYQLFESYEGETFRKLARLFSKTAIKVCEGQQYDVDFEVRDDVTLSEYLKMIEFKTAVLLAAALKMGAIIADAPENEQNAIYEFGKNLGIAFQLQDDYLDAFGDPAIFGKQVGGDIVQNKKTFIYLKAIELANENQRKELVDLFSKKPVAVSAKVSKVKELFKKTGAAALTVQEIGNYTARAFDFLNLLHIPVVNKEMLQKFGEGLIKREV